MNPTRQFAYVLFATLLLSAPSQALDARTTVDSVEGGDFRAIISDRNGVLFTAGLVYVSESAMHAILRRSLDQGSTWETVLDVSPAEGAVANFFNDLALGPGGEVYALQRSSPPLSDRVWRTTDQGQTWQEMTRPPRSGLGVGNNRKLAERSRPRPFGGRCVGASMMAHRPRDDLVHE